MERLKSALASNGGKRRLPGKQDMLAGVTTGIANVPDGMASATLAGVNPIYGVYTLMIGTPVAALTASTQLMMFNTTSAMTLVATDGLGNRTGDERVQALIAVALIAGVFQLALGLLGLGMLTKFVSNSVMVGFLTGISALILMGQLWDLTGYSGEGGSKLEQTAQLLNNLSDIDPATTFVGVGTLVIMLALQSTKLGTFNLLIALAVAIAVQWIFDFESVAMVGEVPSGLPNFDIPEFSLVPALLLAGIATGAVGLLQAAGVAQAYPNPDGSESSDSRDFIGQGGANIASSFFQGMAGGGSLSGTALNVSAGARTRFAGVVQAVVVVVFILVFAGLLARIPSAALAALLIYAAALSIKWAAIITVSKTSWTSLAAMLLTFAATLVVPLQQAVIFGVVMASILFIYRASTDVRLAQVTINSSRLQFADVPDTLPDNAVTVIDVDGNLFYAGARTLSERLPDASTATNAIVIVRIRGQAEIGSTFFKVIGKYADQVRDGGGRLILAGVSESVRDRMARSGNLDEIGEENVFLADSILGDSTMAAEAYGRELLAGLPQAAAADGRTSEREPLAVPMKAEVVRAVESTSVAAAEREPVIAAEDRASLLLTITRAASAYIPWQREAAWKALGILGIINLVIGGIIVLEPGLLEDIFRGVVGAVFLGTAMFWLYQSLTERRPESLIAGQLRMLSAGVALVIGTALVLSEFSDFMTAESARLILAFGLIFIGIIGLASTWFRPLLPNQRIVVIAFNVFLIVLGAIGLIQLERGERLLDRLGWLMIAAGIGLLVYAYLQAASSGTSQTGSDGEPRPDLTLEESMP